MKGRRREDSVVLSQRMLPHYRIELFDRVSRALAGSGIGFELLYGVGNSRNFHWATRLRCVDFEIRMGEMKERLVLIPTLPVQLLRRRPSLCIVEDLGGFPNSALIALYCRLRGVPYLVWGLGMIPGKKRSVLRSLIGPIIDWFYSGAAGFICYSSHAAAVYSARYAQPKFIALNSSVPRPSDAVIESLNSSLADRHGGRILKLVTIGRLLPQKRFDVLLQAFSQSNTDDMELHLIGDGVEREALEARARKCGIRDRVIFHGACFGQVVQNILSECHLGILPGRGGLALPEMMMAALPVVVGVADGTERDIVENRVNGFLFDDVLTQHDIRGAIEIYRNMALGERIQMSRSAMITVREKANVENMTESFVAAIRQQVLQGA